MSDPARDGYQCHGPMQPVGYLGEEAIVGFICVSCGVTRNVAQGEAERARVDAALYAMADTVAARPYVVPEHPKVGRLLPNQGGQVSILTP